MKSQGISSHQYKQDHPQGTMNVYYFMAIRSVAVEIDQTDWHTLPSQELAGPRTKKIYVLPGETHVLPTKKSFFLPTYSLGFESVSKAQEIRDYS